MGGMEGKGREISSLDIPLSHLKTDMFFQKSCKLIAIFEWPDPFSRPSLFFSSPSPSFFPS